MANYSIGLDFGSLSGRAVLVDVKTGAVAAASSFEYPHGAMDRALPDGTPLKSGWVLQHPGDYSQVLSHTVPRLLSASGVKKEEIIGIGVDATACTVLPVDADYTPMCFHEAYRSEPNAYIKMWKHHGAGLRARRMTEAARQQGAAWLERFGGSISGESLFPRLWELMEEAPELYRKMYEYIEVTDYIVHLLTGARVRSSCAAGYKAYYSEPGGYPALDFMETLAPGFGAAAMAKLPSPVLPIGACAGGLTAEMAKTLGLAEGTPVAVGLVDAHAGVPAAGITQPGELLMIIGTSTCHMLLGKKDVAVPGICGSVKGGILPDFYGFEAGQSSVGDLFSHFVNNFVPGDYFEAAENMGLDIHGYLSRLAAKKKPGESGLLALDWLSGNRSTLVDFDLSAAVLGVTARTGPEDVYRALIEATAFGTRVIIDNFRSHGMEVNKLVATGGVSRKNPFLMQLYADILKMPVHTMDSPEGPALGSAVFGALAAGAKRGGYDTIAEAVAAMSGKEETVFSPRAEAMPVCDRLYAEYCRLYDCFGREENSVLKNLRRISGAPTEA